MFHGALYSQIWIHLTPVIYRPFNCNLAPSRQIHLAHENSSNHKFITFLPPPLVSWFVSSWLSLTALRKTSPQWALSSAQSQPLPSAFLSSDSSERRESSSSPLITEWSLWPWQATDLPISRLFSSLDYSHQKQRWIGTQMTFNLRSDAPPSGTEWHPGMGI